MRTINSGRIGHAYIFEGPEGVGKLNMAKAFASAVLCENLKNGESCGSCRICQLSSTGNNPDIQIITNQLYDPAKKSKDILVDTVRSMKQDVYIKPFSSERKVYIVPNADTMNMYAQNSLLKVLEEPPEYCTFILIAENSNMFLPTILSRANVIKFYPLSEEDVFEYLGERFADLSSEKRKMAARMSGGSLSRAELLADDAETEELRSKLIEHVISLIGGRKLKIYDMMMFLRQNKEYSEVCISVLQETFRDLLYLKNFGTASDITNVDKQTMLSESAAKISEKAPQRMLEILFKYKDYISKNISYANISQCLCVELWEAINDRSYRS